MYGHTTVVSETGLVERSAGYAQVSETVSLGHDNHARASGVYEGLRAWPYRR
jgi:hypothetical protein